VSREIILELPVPPSANRWWRNYRGRTVKPESVTAYQTLVAVLARNAGVRMIRRPAEVKVMLAWYRTERRGDLDKRIGILLDSLQGVAYESDAQIAEIHARRVEGRRARVELIVTELPTAPASEEQAA